MTDPTQMIAADGIVAAPVPGQTTSELSGVPDVARSLSSDAWRELRRRPMFLLSVAMIALITVVALFPGLFTNTDPEYCRTLDSRLGPGERSSIPPGSPPGTLGIKHVLGTNLQGCDVYARMLYGARPSVSVGLLVTFGALLVGGLSGMLAGFYGRWVDSLISRIADIFFAIPLLLGAIVVLSVISSRNVFTVALALVILSWPQFARITRAAVISVKDTDYVLAARALGAGDRRILTRHVLPNSLAPVIVVATISLGIFIVTEATLSFLGIGLPGDVISWGGDISSASKRTDPHILLAPASALSLTVLSFILLGDVVRDAFDPRLR